MNIQISNLSNSITDKELRQLFEPYGEVRLAEIAMDVFTNKSRGFGFVEMDNDAEALKAIDTLNQTELDNLTIKVEQTTPREVHRGSYKVGNGAINVYRFRKN